MLQRLKVSLTQPEVVGPVHLRGTTHEVVATRLKGIALAVVPDVFTEITPLLEHLLGIPVLRFLWQPVAALQDQDAKAGGRQNAGQGAATRTTTDDDQIEVAGLGLLQLTERLE